MPHNDSYNFKQTGIYDRIRALVGGNEQRVETWWKTPLSQPPFNLRTPEDLMNDNEWRSVRDYIIDTVPGDYISDTDFKSQSEKFGYTVDVSKVFKLTDKPYGYGGTESKIYVYEVGVKNQDIPVYRVHTFTSSGQIRFDIGGEVEYLVVGGGGGGGGGIFSEPGGGGGGGGVVTGKVSIQPGVYDVVVGAGGTGGTESADQSSVAALRRSSSNGGNSSFWNIVAYGGGAGGHSSTPFSNGNPLSGATGGGGTPNTGFQVLTGVVVYNPNRVNGAPAIYGDAQGYAGGNAISVTLGTANPAGGTWGNTASNAGGGGGAGGPGGNATNLKAGDGGIGKLSNITGEPVYYGGGGAGGCYGIVPFLVSGGTGGLGGGSTTLGYVHLNNNASYVPPAGVPNTGGGGGGGFSTNGGSNGGSGIVIIRYRLTT